jgi:hypothetical protein
MLSALFKSGFSFRLSNTMFTDRGVKATAPYLCRILCKWCSAPVIRKNCHIGHVSSQLLQGCQMVYFQPQNPNSGQFWRALEWKMTTLRQFVQFNTVWYSLWSFGMFFPFWYIWTKKIWQPCTSHLVID